jgi:hypothetical protein
MTPEQLYRSQQHETSAQLWKQASPTVFDQQLNLDSTATADQLSERQKQTHYLIFGAPARNRTTT